MLCYPCFIFYNPDFSSYSTRFICLLICTLPILFCITCVLNCITCVLFCIICVASKHPFVFSGRTSNLATPQKPECQHVIIILKMCWMMSMILILNAMRKYKNIPKAYLWRKELYDQENFQWVPPWRLTSHFNIGNYGRLPTLKILSTTSHFPVRPWKICQAGTPPRFFMLDRRKPRKSGDEMGWTKIRLKLGDKKGLDSAASRNVATRDILLPRAGERRRKGKNKRLKAAPC